MNAEQYNYADFDLKRESPPFEEFRRSLHVTERAPSFPLEDLSSGETVELKSLWRTGVAILEFGSFT